MGRHEVRRGVVRVWERRRRRSLQSQTLGLCHMMARMYAVAKREAYIHRCSFSDAQAYVVAAKVLDAAFLFFLGMSESEACVVASCPEAYHDQVLG